MSRYYAPDGTPIASSALGDYEPHVARDTVHGAEVSTVWFGINHGHGGGPPLIFETMVFGGPYDQSCDRYSTLEEAEAGHARWVKKLTKSGPWCGVTFGYAVCEGPPVHDGPHVSTDSDGEVTEWTTRKQEQATEPEPTATRSG